MAAAKKTNMDGAASAALLQQIRTVGRTLDDVEAARIRVSNRISAIGKHGDSLIEESMPVGLLASFEQLQVAEAMLVTELEQTWKEHPLYGWSRHIPGVGEKLISRLLAETGDPLLRQVGHFENGRNEKRTFIVDGYEPRTFAQLCAYTGHGDPALSRRRRGVIGEEARAGGNTTAKKRVFLIAAQGIKSRCPACRLAARERDDSDVSYAAPSPDCTCARTHPLRHAYDVARAKYAEGHVYKQGEVMPRKVKVGDPWTPGRQHAAALRYVGKTFLRMLHDAARDPERAAREAKAAKTATAESQAPFGADEAASSREGEVAA